MDNISQALRRSTKVNKFMKLQLKLLTFDFYILLRATNYSLVSRSHNLSLVLKEPLKFVLDYGRWWGMWMVDSIPFC